MHDWYFQTFVKAEHGPQKICKEACLYRAFGLRVGGFIVNTLRRLAGHPPHK